MNDEEIFHQALTRNCPQERAAYLDQVCGGDSALRASVEALLRANIGASGFMDRPLAALLATVDDPISERPGMVIESYKLMEQIGEGGMGLVFVAEQQQPVRRKVALKVIKPGMDTRQVVARFEAERQALALMDHPNIAKVLHGGTTASGRPYFVMELVKGVPITEYCDQNRVPIRQRLELFVSVCQAVQHAHQKGIIHRDLKPSNVLVVSHDGTPVVKVIDFGVAKAIGQRLTDKTIYTQFSQMVGTPLYMSPEQAGQSGLDVDTRSDIYSLGVLLYELLTGSTPFDKERLREVGYDEIRRIIREDEPPNPSTRISTLGKAATTVSMQRQCDPKRLRRLFRGELDWIVMKALEKDRNRRYHSANGFAMDVQRYLQDEPVLACPPSPWYRFLKFSRRNKLVLLAATVIVATLIVAGATVTWKWWEAEDAREQEREAKYKIEEALDQAQRAEQRAKQDEGRAVAAERQARLREAEALVGQAHGTRLSRRPGQRFEALNALSKAAAIGRELDQPPEWFNRLRNEAIAALALPDIHITHEFGSFPPGSRWVELNEDFTLYARTTNKGGCTIRRVDDDTEVARLQELGEPAEASFGLGRILAVRGLSGRFQLWDLNGAEPALRFEAPGISNDYRFRNDGRLLALPHRDGSIGVYETASGKRVHQLAPGQIVQDLHTYLHPTAPFVACSSYHSHDVQVRDLNSGAVVATAMPPWPHGSYACWSPDGRTLLVTEANGGMIQEYAFDSAALALRLIRSIQGPSMGHATITFNPTGDRFVRRGWENIVVLFDTASGQELFHTHSLQPASNCRLLRFDQTGQRLAGARVGDRKDRIGLWSVADGREYLSLTNLGNGIGATSIHPGGRLAAVGSTDGVVLFDVETGRILDRLAIGNRVKAVSFDGTGSLLTNGFEGFFRWPVRADAATPGRWTIGPPERLPFQLGDMTIATSRDGRVVAQCMWHGYGMGPFAGGWILHPNSPRPRWVEAGAGMGCCSVSPDGRWVAFGGPHLLARRAAINVYETATARRVWQLPADAGYGLFSPDGRWLVTDTDGGRLYAVGTWEPGPQFGPGEPRHVTSHLAVFGQTNGSYRLVELATGRELARLEDPELNNGAAALTPDGTKLVVSVRNGLRIWDLRRIRTELAKLGLDWDSPPLPAAAGAEAAPLSIHTKLGDFLQWAKALALVRQATQHSGAKEHTKALEALRQAVKMAPDCAVAHNNLAWLLLTGPKQLRDPAKALIEAKRAVEVEPEQSLYINTLGVALYYTEHYADAIPVLERSLREQKGQADAFDFFFLAMCHHRLGDAAKAKDCHQRGSRWLQRNKGKFSTAWLEELTAFQAEAAAVLAQPPGQGKK